MDQFKKAIELGLGALVITRENADKLTKELVKKGKINSKESKDLIKEIMKKGQAEERKIESAVARMVGKTFAQLDLASKSDVRKLEKEIKKLKAHKH